MFFVATHPETSYRVLTEVLYTAGQAEFGRYFLLGRDRENGVVVEMVDAPRSGPGPLDGFRVACSLFISSGDRSGVGVVKDNDNDPLMYRTYDLLLSPCGDSTSIALAADACTSVQDVFRVLDVVADHTCQPGRRQLVLAAGL